MALDLRNGFWLTEGSESKVEGFSPYKYHLPQSTDEGGCYVETCASVACMMLSERLLSHELDGEVREVLETCFHNTVLGGASLDGKQFSYENKLATCANESAQRKDWFDGAFPSMSSTMALILTISDHSLLLSSKSRSNDGHTGRIRLGGVGR